MVIENAKTVYLFERHRALIYKFTESEKKKIKKKYAKKIQDDWYDYDEQMIENKIREVDKAYDLLCDLQKRLYEKQ